MMSKKQAPKINCKYDAILDPEKLKSHPNNPNTHPDAQMTALVGYISTTGWRHPVIVSKQSGLIVAGHARVQAAKQIGCSVPVVYQDFSTDADEIAFLLADNHLAELSIIDEKQLLECFDILENYDFDLASIGYEQTLFADDCSASDNDEEEEIMAKRESEYSKDTDYAEIKVFVKPEMRKKFFDEMQNFKKFHGELSIRWQRA